MAFQLFLSHLTYWVFECAGMAQWWVWWILTAVVRAATASFPQSLPSACCRHGLPPNAHIHCFRRGLGEEHHPSWILERVGLLIPIEQKAVQQRPSNKTACEIQENPWAYRADIQEQNAKGPSWRRHRAAAGRKNLREGMERLEQEQTGGQGEEKNHSSCERERAVCSSLSTVQPR